MASVDELDALLQALQALKPPGVAKSKIEAINAICIVNVGSDSTLVEKIVAHFRSTPATHKLGVLYVVDSVTRQWIEKARQTGQALIGSAAAPGTYASGVHKMTEVLPTMMSELIVSAPENQKDKIGKLIDIWEKANTFPTDMLADFKRKLEGPTQSMRTFPANGTAQRSVINNQPAAVSSGNNAAFVANTTIPPAAPLGFQGSTVQQLPGNQPANAAPPSLDNLAAALGMLQQNAQPAQHLVYPQAGGNAPNLASQMQALSLPQPNGGIQPAAVQQPAPPMPANPPAPNNFNGDIQQQVNFLTTLVQSGLSPDQIAQVVTAMGLPMPPAPPPPVAVPQPAPGPYEPINGSASHAAPTANDGYEYRRPRSRSRSPDRDFKRRRVTPPNRRESPVYGVYDPEAIQNEASRSHEMDRRGGRSRGGRNHRKSPPGKSNDRVASPMVRGGAPAGMQPKYITFDSGLPKGSIRVLSRTLFVGGVSATEQEIRDIFSRFGKVQTCIVNQDKRHAFVKMVDRQGAQTARDGMEYMKDQDVNSKIRSTKWGVGFGPRECSDYSKGISVVPINALTEADKRWLLTAEYGGTGGQPIESGMVVEEPDIEIGAGVSSKAISRRIETGSKRRDRKDNFVPAPPNNVNNYPQDKYGYDRPANPPARPAYESNQSRHREPDPVRAKPAAPAILKPEPNTVGVPPAVPGFGFQLPGMNFR